MWKYLKALALTFLDKVRWILGVTASQPPSPVYKPERKLLTAWEPNNVYYIDDDLGELLGDSPTDIVMQIAPELGTFCNTKKDQ